MDSISPKMTILLVAIPIERAMAGLSPVAMKACPYSVFKNSTIKPVTIAITISPKTTLSKYCGSCFKKALEKRVVWPIKDRLDLLPMIRRLTE